MEDNLSIQVEHGDTQLVCQKCGQSFVFTQKERSFFDEMGFVPPRYCADCRKNRKKEGKKEGDWKDFYEVNCDRCGSTTTVPFKPVNGRPVYCRNCLTESRTGETSNPAGEGLKDQDRIPTFPDSTAVPIAYHHFGDVERPYQELDTIVSAMLEKLLPRG